MFGRYKAQKGEQNAMLGSRIEEIELNQKKFEVEFSYRVIQCPALSECDICGLKQISTFGNELEKIEGIREMSSPTMEEINQKSLLGRQIVRKLKSIQFFAKRYCILCDLP